MPAQLYLFLNAPYIMTLNGQGRWKTKRE